MLKLKKLVPILFLLLFGMTGTAAAGLNDYFVDTDWLESNRDQVTVVDVRRQPFYLLGHIDGALHVERDAFLSLRSGVKSLVPTATEFQAMMSRLGITPETTVVAYAEDDNPYGARFVWTLRYHGHEKAYVLDGGYDKWKKEKRPTALLPTSPAGQTDYRLKTCCDIRAEGDYVLTRMANPDVVIWDTRRRGEYLGTEVRADRGGHIPQAVHLRWTHLLREVDGVKVLKSEEEIRKLLAASGITSDREIVAHCQTGIRSSYATLVLLGLGYERARNYDGSWIEWANNPELPIMAGEPEAQGEKVSLSR